MLITLQILQQALLEMSFPEYRDTYYFGRNRIANILEASCVKLTLIRGPGALCWLAAAFRVARRELAKTIDPECSDVEAHLDHFGRTISLEGLRAVLKKTIERILETEAGGSAAAE